MTDAKPAPQEKPQPPRRPTPQEETRGRLQQIGERLSKSTGFFQELLPKHLPAERLIKTVLFCLAKKTSLLNCSDESILLATTQAAELGLEPSDARGLCYLVPYKGSVQLQIGYRGLLLLAREGGVLKVESHVVYDKDKFSIKKGDRPRISHEPWVPPAGKVGKEASPGQPVGAYSIAWLGSGMIHREWMDYDEIEKIRASSRAKDDGPWVEWWDEMARKSVFKRQSKWLPSGARMRKALSMDDADGPTLDAQLVVRDVQQPTLPEKQVRSGDQLAEQLRKAKDAPGPVPVRGEPPEVVGEPEPHPFDEPPPDPRYEPTEEELAKMNEAAVGQQNLIPPESVKARPADEVYGLIYNCQDLKKLQGEIEREVKLLDGKERELAQKMWDAKALELRRPKKKEA